MIAIDLPVLFFDGWGTTQLFSHALSIIACSIDFIPTGSELIFRVQAASHGAGQIRAVNSGKLFVEWRTLIAASQSCLKTKSFQSGIILFTGHPLLQNGIPQSIQRAPWTFASSSDKCKINSL